MIYNDVLIGLYWDPSGLFFTPETPTPPLHRPVFGCCTFWFGAILDFEIKKTDAGAVSETEQNTHALTGMYFRALYEADIGLLFSEAFGWVGIFQLRW